MYAKPVKQNEILFEFYHNDMPSNFSSEIRQNKIQEASLDRKYTKPGLQAEKKAEHTINSKRIIVAMTDCLVKLYPA